MPIVFIHGVNVRDTKGYRQTAGLRRRMFQTLVISPLASRFGSLEVAEDIFWGDLGVTYRWDLQSLPKVELEGLGAEDGFTEVLTHSALFDVVAASETRSVTPSSRALEPLGPRSTSGLANAANKDAATTAAAIVAGERAALIDSAARLETESAPTAAPEEAKRDELEGERIASLLLAMELVAGDPAVATTLATATTDDQVIDAVHNAITDRYAEPATPVALEGLGVRDWVKDKLKRLGDGVKRVASIASQPKDATLRAASLGVLAWKREAITRRASIFLGDIFEYLRRGQDDNAGISERVELRLRAVAALRSDDSPLVVVSHSFGSAIFYDLVTSERFEGPVDLWVSAGAQVPFFAEMRFFATSPDDVPRPEQHTLQRPPQIRRWLNVWDPADVLSFIAKPVFGDTVKDVIQRDGANVADAHSAYFTSRDFYEHLRTELAAL